MCLHILVARPNLTKCWRWVRDELTLQWAIFDPLWRVCWRGRGNAGLFKVEAEALGNLFYFINEIIQSIPTLRRTVNTYWTLDRY